MNAVILVLSVVGPLLPVVMFPTKFIGRGGLSTIIGAGMLVGMMMLVYFSLNGLMADPAPGAKTDPALAGVSDADMSALQTLF